MQVPAFLRGAMAMAIVAAAFPAFAASPEETYFAARDAAIARFKAIEETNRVDDAAMKAHDEALAALGRDMRAVIGPVSVKGGAAGHAGHAGQEGAINLSTLFSGDQGFGTLDGLVFGTPDDPRAMIVTTESILAVWLKAHERWWGDKSAMPQRPAAAFRSPDFYTQAVQTDAAVVSFGDLAVAKPVAAKVAYAMLAARTQSEPPRVPDEIFVAAIQGGRVFVARAAIEQPFKPVPACEAERRRLEAAADKAPPERSIELRDKSDAQFLRCFAGQAGKQPAFAAAVRQAQALLDGLPAR